MENTKLNDKSVEIWLKSKGIDPALALTLSDVKVEGSIIKYPRYGLDGSVMGYKVRNVHTGKQYNTPSGIHVHETLPWVIHAGRPNMIVCEGESDTMAVGLSDLSQRLCAATLCVPGASTFPAAWAKQLRAAHRVWVASDYDEPGNRLAKKIAALVPGVRRLLPMHEGSDMCDALLTTPTDVLVAKAESATIIRGDVRLDRQWHDKTGIASRYSHRLAVEVVRDGIELSRNGVELKGCCPFHEEKTPSFHVNQKKGLFICFGCGAKGDVITYLRKKRGMSFREACEYIKR